MMNLREKGKRHNNDSRLSDDESVGSEKKKARIDEQGDRDADAAADDDNDDPKEPQQVETNLKFSISFGARRVDKAVYPFNKEFFECTSKGMLECLSLTISRLRCATISLIINFNRKFIRNYARSRKALRESFEVARGYHLRGH